MKMRILLAALALVGATAFGPFTMLQNSLLYYPQNAPVAAVVSDRLVAWPSAGAFRGLIAEPTGAARATAIVFHGNAGHAGQRDYYARALAPLGTRVILAEYPGYGPREGALGEQQLVEDAAQSIALAHRTFGEPLFVIGESLGAGVAAAAIAAQRDKVSGVLLITPWDRLANVASHHYPWLPVSWLLRDRYDSVANLAAFDRPIAIAVAEQDSIVPARFGTALHDSLAAPKRLAVMRGVGHNDWLERVDDAWWRELLGFLRDGAARAR